MSNQAPGLDDYEKSVFLTQAQDDIIKAYFNPSYTKSGEGFDGNLKRQIDFSMLTKVDIKKEPSDFSSALFDLRENSKCVNMPKDALFVINEQCTVTRGTKTVILQVIPIQYTEYTRLMTKPFKRPIQYQAWRLLNTNESTKNDLVVGPNDTITKYVIRYVMRPPAIILSDLEGVSIEGVSTAQECVLDPEIHFDILQRAVELAKAAYSGTLQDVIQAGQASSTEKGVISRLQLS